MTEPRKSERHEGTAAKKVLWRSQHERRRRGSGGQDRVPEEHQRDHGLDLDEPLDETESAHEF